jgi:hypothetical protein
MGVTFIYGTTGLEPDMGNDDLAGDDSGKPLKTVVKSPFTIGPGG